MKPTHDRAFKEWAVSCQTMAEGRQILLIRKGGIREESGVFRIHDPEFWLMPTYEHQNAALLQLDQSYATDCAIPVLTDTEFAVRRDALLTLLNS